MDSEPKNLLPNPLTSQQPILVAYGKVLAKYAHIQLYENIGQCQNARCNKMRLLDVCSVRMVGKTPRTVQDVTFRHWVQYA
jgi:hypothetical protein